MELIVVGVLSDYKGRVLLQQSDNRTLIPIHRRLEPGVLPADTLARAFREDTTLTVLPVRLTGLHYRAEPAGGELAFYFRCIMRGGDLAPPDGRPPAGFFDSAPLPRALSSRFHGPLAATLNHAGGPPLLTREERGLGQRLSRLLGNRPAAGGDDWAITITVIARRPDGQIVWTRHEPNGMWHLPTAAPAPGEAPWAAAERLGRQAGLAGGAATLSAVEMAANQPAANQPAATLLFTMLLGEAARLSPPQQYQMIDVTSSEAADISQDDRQRLARRDDPAAPSFIVMGGE